MLWCVLVLTASCLLLIASVCACMILWSYTAAVITNNAIPSSLTAVIAENMTVKVVTLPLSEVSSIAVTEVVYSDDNAHTGYAVVVPYDKLKEKRVIGMKNFTGITLDRIPIVNVPYIYLLKQSVLEFNICIGNAPIATTRPLYIFNNGDQYETYILSEIVTSSVLKKEINIGGENESVCNSFSYTVLEDSYYFAVLIAPRANIEITYSLIADERVLDIYEYLKDYPACLLKPDEDCNLDNINGNDSAAQNVSLLVLMEPNYDLNSRLTHVEITVTTHIASSAIEVIIVNGSIASAVIMVLLVVLVVGILIRCKKKKSKIDH